MLNVMKKFLLLSFTFLIFPYSGFAEDTLTITTYYPSPYGVYRELRAKRMAIGENYTSGANYTWQDTESGSGEIDFDADLVVEGNVGIGTVNPASNLHIASSTGMALEYLTAGDNSQTGIFFVTNYLSSADYAGIGIRTDGSLALTGGASIASPNMVINNSGNVGIGTTSPGAMLQIGAGTGSLHVLTPGLLLKNSTSYERSIMEIHDPTGANRLVIQTLADTSYIASLDAKPIAFQTSGGNVGIGTGSPEAKLHISAGDNSFVKFGPNATYGAFLVVGTGAAVGDCLPASGRAVILSSSGNLHLDAGTGKNVYIGWLTAAATYISGSWYGSSDQRLKKNIQTIPDSKGLVAINKLNPVSYTRIDNPGGGTQLGFVAQQVQSIFPELVSNSAATTLTPGGTLAINYIGLLPPIVKAIQELKKQNEILQVENKQQDSRIKKLEVKLNKSCK